MWWVLIAVVVIIAAFAVPRFGLALLGIIGLLGFAGTVWYFVNEYQESVSKKRISVNEIALSDLVLVPQYSAESYELQGRVKNKSPRYTLSSLQVKITMRDCVKPQTCETVGESTAWIFNDVPSGQAPNVEKSVYFSNLPKPRGKHEWYYSITEIKGE